MLPTLLSLALLGLGALVAENPYDVEGGLSPGDIAGYAKKAGFPDEVIPEAVRIVLLESKGQPDKLQNDKGPGKPKDSKPNDKDNVVDADFEDVKEDKEKSA